MAHYHEKTLIDKKEELTSHLIYILSDPIYDGISKIYKHSIEQDKQIQANGGKNLGPIQTFQRNLENIGKLSEEKIQAEVERIRSLSKCSDTFDDLIRAVIKTYIILYTYKSPSKKSDIVEGKYHETVSISNFIHKCYIESARNFYNSPMLFWHKYQPLVIKENQKESYAIIDKSIKEAIRQVLPMRPILTEYLQDDYAKDDELLNVSVTRDDYERIKYLLDESKKMEDIKNANAANLMNYGGGHIYDNIGQYNNIGRGIRGINQMGAGVGVGVGVGVGGVGGVGGGGGSIFVTDDSSDFNDAINGNDIMGMNDGPAINIIKLDKNQQHVPLHQLAHMQYPLQQQAQTLPLPMQIPHQQYPQSYYPNLPQQEQNQYYGQYNGSIHDVPPNAPKIFDKHSHNASSDSDLTDSHKDESRSEKGKKLEIQYINIDDDDNKRPTNFNFVGNTKNKLAEKFGIVIDGHKVGKDNKKRSSDSSHSRNHKREDKEEDKDKYFMRYK
jgi:hypothetical protein